MINPCIDEIIDRYAEVLNEFRFDESAVVCNKSAGDEQRHRWRSCADQDTRLRKKEKQRRDTAASRRI